MQISFYKSILRGPGSEPRHDSAPDTYHNIQNLTLYPAGLVLFSHLKGGKEEVICCNNPFKIIATPEEWATVFSSSKEF